MDDSIIRISVWPAGSMLFSTCCIHHVALVVAPPVAIGAPAATAAFNGSALRSASSVAAQSTHRSRSVQIVKEITNGSWRDPMPPIVGPWPMLSFRSSIGPIGDWQA